MKKKQYHIHYPNADNCPACKSDILHRRSSIRSKNGWLQCLDCGHRVTVKDTKTKITEIHENGVIIKEIISDEI